MRALLFALVASSIASPALAQSKPAAPQKPASQSRSTAPNPNPIRVRAFGTFGSMTFRAEDSFDTILDSHSGLIFGGGGHVLLPWGLYAELGISRFAEEGERVFIGPGDEVFPLGIPVEISIMPIEITGGWRYRHCPAPPAPPRAPKPPPSPQSPRTTTPQSTARAAPRACEPKFIPDAGGGLSVYRYSESGEFSDSSENVDESFTGFHLLGGAEYRLMRWVSIGGEIVWSSVPDALGAGGVSAAFSEDNLGGTAIRVKVTVGR